MRSEFNRISHFFMALLIFAILLCYNCSPAFMHGFARGYQASKKGTSGTKIQKCPSCNMDMYFTGETETEWGRLFYLYECPVGHTYWFPAREKQTSTYVKNPCPVCGMETYFTGETYTEWGKLFKIYECPVGHQSVKEW